MGRRKVKRRRSKKLCTARQLLRGTKNLNVSAFGVSIPYDKECIDVSHGIRITRTAAQRAYEESLQKRALRAINNAKHYQPALEGTMDTDASVYTGGEYNYEGVARGMLKKLGLKPTKKRLEAVVLTLKSCFGTGHWHRAESDTARRIEANKTITEAIRSMATPIDALAHAVTAVARMADEIR